MGTSPEKNASGVVTYTIKCDGTEIKSTIGILEINVYTQVNRIAKAELLIEDGNAADQDFAISNQSTFKPGATISIAVGYDSSESTIFTGLITGHSIAIATPEPTCLIVTCMDAAVKTTIARHSKCYLAQSDSDVIGSILADYSGITSGTIDTTKTTHAELAQFNCTDWDFILSRAEANGLVVVNGSNTIDVTAPATSDSAVLTVTYGTDLIAFSGDIDARYQLKKVTGVSWDVATQKTVSASASTKTISNQGNLSSSTLAKVLGLSDYRLQSSGSWAESALNDWAAGQQIKSELAKSRGSVTFQGSAKAKINSLLELAGVGDRFNGPQYISGVHHCVKSGQWLTTADLGMSPMWSAEHRDLGAPFASGLLPPSDGLIIGIVTKLDADPESLNRIQVKIPVLGDSDNLIWARLLVPYASATGGLYFIPEVDSEVLIGYLNNDPSNPIVLGCLYNGTAAPLYDLSAENTTKAIVSNGKLNIEFDDEKLITTLTTPGGHTISLDDDATAITLNDSNGNSVVLNDSGITLDSASDIAMTATGDITMSATKGISLKATQDLAAEGMNVKLTGSTGLTAKSSATAEVSASAILTLKGAMVKIN